MRKRRLVRESTSDEFDVSAVFCKNCDQDSCFINRYCSKEWKTKLANIKTTQNFKKDQQILFQNSTVTGIHFIYSGDVQVFREYPQTNQTRILRIAKSGDILGHRGYGDDLNYPISASALSACKVCFIDTNDFYDTMKHNPDFSIHLALFYADELRKADNKFLNFTSMSVKQRLALTLSGLAKSHGIKKNKTTEIRLSLSRQILMNLIATTYESTVRMIRELTKQKIIKFSENTIIILDLKKLNEISQG